MDQTILFIIIGASSLVGGLVLGKLVFARNTKKQVEEAEAQGANILKEAELRAETIKKENVKTEEVISEKSEEGEVKQEMDNKGFNPDFPYVHQRDERRCQDLWDYSEPVRQFSCKENIISILETLYDRETIPFQTLNFKFGSQQRAHSDTIHFSSLPARFMCGVWVALEDINEENGPLFYYPGSHKTKEFNFNDFRDDLGRDRLNISRVRQFRIGHDRRRVRIDEDDAIALFLQRLDRLCAGIIKLARLTNDNRASANDEDGGNVSSFWHYLLPIIPTNFSNR